MPSSALFWVLICIAVLVSACSSTTQNPTQRPLVSQTTSMSVHLAMPTSSSTTTSTTTTTTTTTILVDEPADIAVALVEPEVEEVIDEVIDVERHGWPLPSFAGMYPRHPEDGESPDTSREEGYTPHPSSEFGTPGVLSIEPPCVYVTLLHAERYVEGGVVNDAPYRVALSLPYPLVRLGDNAEILWFGNTPFVTGEWVSMTQHLHYKPTSESAFWIRGTEYFSNIVILRFTNYVDFAPRHSVRFWNRCAADGFMRVGSLNRMDCAQRMVPDVRYAERDAMYAERPMDFSTWCDHRDAVIKRGLVPIADPPSGDLSVPLLVDLAPPPFYYMHVYHPHLESEVAALMGDPTETTGMFAIGPPSARDPRTGTVYETERECVYLYPTRDPTTSWRDLWQHRNADGQPLAIRLEMPYPQVRYDPNTQTIWNNDVGPIIMSDRVTIKTINEPDFNINGKQPNETIGGQCPNSNAYAKVIDIQPTNQ